MSNLQKLGLATTMLTSKKELADAKSKLFNMMEDYESFDFKVGDKTYRCYRRAEMIVSRPKINKDKGTFTMQDVVVKPTIVIREINKRKEIKCYTK